MHFIIYSVNASKALQQGSTTSEFWLKDAGRQQYLLAKIQYYDSVSYIHFSDSLCWICTIREREIICEFENREINCQLILIHLIDIVFEPVTLLSSAGLRCFLLFITHSEAVSVTSAQNVNLRPLTRATDLIMKAQTKSPCREDECNQTLPCEIIV